VNHYWHPELLEHFAGRPTSLVIYTPAGTRTRLSTPHSSTGRLIMARMLFSARTSSSRLHLTVRGRSISEISGRFGKDLSQASGTRCTVRPDYWRQDCQFCYDEDDFYSEVVRTALYGLGTVQEEAEIDEVVESATSTFGATPPSLNQDCENFSKSGQKIIDSDHCETRNRVYAGSSRNRSIGTSVTSS